MIRLEPLTADAWQRWTADSIPAYAADKVRVGAWPAEGAEARAAADLLSILPDGQSTPGHDFRSIVNDEGEHVGVLWFAAAEGSLRRAVFIWDILIFEAFRGRGYGRAALSALEPIVRELGYAEIGLHVFGDNEIARNLYRSAGFVETDVSMVKRLT